MKPQVQGNLIKSSYRTNRYAKHSIITSAIDSWNNIKKPLKNILLKDLSSNNIKSVLSNFYIESYWWLLFIMKLHTYMLFSLKLVSTIFIKSLFFIKWEPFKNCEKCFLFHLKSSFRSRDIQIFVIFPLPFHAFQIQKNKWKWNNLWCHELAGINLQV